MHDSYAAVADFDLPPAMSPPTGFTAEVRIARDWVKHLPMANPGVARQWLEQALSALASARCAPANRLEILEALREPIGVLAPALWRPLRNTSLPLPAPALGAMSALQSLYGLLALGYRQVAADWCAPKGRPPVLRAGKVGLALRRACADLAQVLRASWLGYRAPPAGTWSALHRLHAFARARGLESAHDERTGEASCAQSYRCCLLAEAANPYALTQAEQGSAWDVLRPFALRLPLIDAAPDECAIAFETDADVGPQSSVPGQPALDPQPLREYLRTQLHSEYAQVAPALARRLLKGLDSLAERAADRRPAGHILDTVLGLGAVHFQLCGGLDFETFLRSIATPHQYAARNERQTARGDISWATPLPAQVLDQSSKGYRLLWRAEVQARIRVGEVVALTPAGDRAEPRAWILGLVRWLRVEDLGGVSAGVELLGLRANALALRQAQRHAEAVRAVVFSRDTTRIDGLLLAATSAPELTAAQAQMLPCDPVWVGGGPAQVNESLARMRECERPGDNILYLNTRTEVDSARA